jgi:hypothetical protein
MPADEAFGEPLRKPVSDEKLIEAVTQAFAAKA